MVAGTEGDNARHPTSRFFWQRPCSPQLRSWTPFGRLSAHSLWSWRPAGVRWNASRCSRTARCYA